MDKTKLYIKNMVCDRCILVVRQEFERLDLPVHNIILGEVTVDNVNDDQKKILKERLEGLGFELIHDKRAQTVERIKAFIIDLIYKKDVELKNNLSVLLEQNIGQDYHQLSTLFSDVEDTTIEKYFIAQKVERVKELLMYNEFTLSEIANQLHYSSVAYLSNQFKKSTGLSPSEFKKSGLSGRITLDRI